MDCTTFVYELMPNGIKREMTKIHRGSQFFGMKVPKEIKKTQETPASQEHIARMFRAGWINNGSMDPMQVTIEQRIFAMGHAETRRLC